MEILKRRLFHANRVFNFFLEHVRDERGREVEEFFVAQPKNIRPDLGGGVAVLPILHGKIGLVRIFRVPLREAFWEIPHGFVDAGEDDRAAAVRELAEEAGIEARAEDLISLGWITPDAGIISARVHLFAVEGGEFGRPTAGELGIESFTFFDFAEVDRMVMESEIQDAYTVAAYLKYRAWRGR